jgi:hypothetical protein
MHGRDGDQSARRMILADITIHGICLGMEEDQCYLESPYESSRNLSIGDEHVLRNDHY